MKKGFLLLALAGFVISFASCKKCYDCTTTQVVDYDTGDPDTDDFLSYETEATSEKCDKKKDIEDYEKKNSGTVTSGNYTATTTTTCEKQ